MSHKINIEICETQDDVALLAAGKITTLVRNNPQSILGLSTGATPIPTYEEIIRAHRKNAVSFAEACTFNLDEYWGLGSDHPQSYRQFMNSRLFDHIDIPLWNTHLLNGKAASPQLECQSFEASILARGGIDLWLLGIGVNGHIAFNEPGSPVSSRTRLVELSKDSIKANSRFFDSVDQVPQYAISVGVATILEARTILLLATGNNKANAVARALSDPPGSDCPASFLQSHPDCTFIVDRSVGSRIETHH